MLFFSLPLWAQEEESGLHQTLRDKFVEGGNGFMSVIAAVLVIGLAFCIERIIYLSLSEINAKRLMADIEKKVEAGDVEGAKTLCRETRGPVASILGTVIGMVMAFDQIEFAGDISPTIVAGGMKVALITTIFGIIVALILQLFYNYILSKIDHLTAQMEESAISLLDVLGKVKS